MEEGNKKKSYQVVTLGCRTNQYESQAYIDQLEQMGYKPAKGGKEADVCIVNTCTVTESADASSRQKIRSLARENPNAKIVVTGCSAERDKEAIEALDGVAAVVPNGEKEQLLARLFPEEEIPEFNIRRFDAHTRAFIKVQDGCNSYCTYCIIPYVRGRSRSRTVKEVVAEARQLIENGYKEIVLTGINIGDFDGGEEGGASLAELVSEVDGLPGLERLRLSSIDPDEVDDELADAIINGRKTCQSMHIVLQSGSNVVLKRMNRKYSRHLFFETVDRLRAASPNFTFTTDVIVGFPGETEVDHQETLAAIREVKFAKVHMFPYSDRPKTRSATMPNKVASDIIRRRKHEVMRLSEQVAFELRKQHEGEVMTILTEKGDAAHPGMIGGHTDNFLMVWIPDEGIGSNQLVDVVLKENRPDGFLGTVNHVHRSLKVVGE